MQLQIIENDHIAFVQARCQLCFDIAFKGVAVHGAVDDPGRDEFMTAQACDEGLGLPFAKRRLRPQPFATWRAPAPAHHIGFHAGFVDEDEAAGLTPHARLTLADPAAPLRADVTAPLFAGQKRFFYSSTPPHRAAATRKRDGPQCPVQPQARAPVPAW